MNQAMKSVNSIREVCTILQRIEEAGEEASLLLYLYGYADRPDILDVQAALYKLKVLIDFDPAFLREALDKVSREQKEKGCPEVAVKAAELCYRLYNLEKETKSSE